MSKVQAGSVVDLVVTLQKMRKDLKSLDTDDWIPYPVRLLSIEGGCKYLSCSGDLLEELIATGEIHVIRLGKRPKGSRDRRKRWLDRVELDSLIEERKTKTGSTT